MFRSRLRYRWRARHEQIAVSLKTTFEDAVLGLAFVGMVLVPPTYVLTSFLSFADYQLPAWSGSVGTVVFLFALWLLWRTHHDLGKNWSQTLELRKGAPAHNQRRLPLHQTPNGCRLSGVGLVQPLLLQNWIAGWSHMVAFLPLSILRVPREEEMMREQFGTTYRS